MTRWPTWFESSVWITPRAPVTIAIAIIPAALSESSRVLFDPIASSTRFSRKAGTTPRPAETTIRSRRPLSRSRYGRKSGPIRRRFARRFSGSTGRSGGDSAEWKNMPIAPRVCAACLVKARHTSVRRVRHRGQADDRRDGRPLLGGRRAPPARGLLPLVRASRAPEGAVRPHGGRRGCGPDTLGLPAAGRPRGGLAPAVLPLAAVRPARARARPGRDLRLGREHGERAGDLARARLRRHPARGLGGGRRADGVERRDDLLVRSERHRLVRAAARGDAR